MVLSEVLLGAGKLGNACPLPCALITVVESAYEQMALPEYRLWTGNGITVRWFSPSAVTIITSNRPSSPSAPAAQLTLRTLTWLVCSLAPGTAISYPQQTPEEAASSWPDTCGPPQHWVGCPAGASSSAWTASQRCSSSWPQKVALSARTV